MNYVNEEGQTPLTLTAKLSFHGIECALLLLENKADCVGNAGRPAADAEQRTALHWAAVNNNICMIDLLITRGANKDAQDAKVMFR